MPDDLRGLLEHAFLNRALLTGTFSSPAQKDAETAKKITVKPVKTKAGFVFQFEEFYAKRVLHENLKPSAAFEKAVILARDTYRQTILSLKEADFHIFSTDRGEVKILKQKPTRLEAALSHDRPKNYRLAENQVADYLIHLGIMNADGMVFQKKYDKFRQINKFLEFVEDAINKARLPEHRLRVIDFGCGKAYLTFALYHYLTSVRGLSVEATGLDLKEDVIAFCNRTADELEYRSLHFAVGDIASYDFNEKPQLVVTLHACDTATDEALLRAIQWQTDIILSVPCCQHELFPKIRNTELRPLMKHGILKEKLSSLVTDALRASLLEAFGYEVSVMEFIDMEHTPKNVLIRALLKKPGFHQEKYRAFQAFLKTWGLEATYLEKGLAARRLIPESEEG